MIALLVALTLPGCERKTSGEAPESAAPGAEAAPPLDIGLAISSYVHAVVWIAKDTGAMKRHGLKAPPNVEVMGGSAATMRALLGESIDVGVAGGDAVLKARAAGADLVIIAGLVNRFYHRIVGAPSIQSIEELRGKKIGLSFLGGPQDTAVKVALEQAGLAYGEDVEVLNMGREFNRMAALRAGEIHATTSQTPPSRLAEMKLHVLADLPASEAAFPYAMVVVERDTLERRPEQLEALLASLCEATTFYREREQESLAIIASHIKGADTQAAAKERYELAGPTMLSSPPTPDPKGFETVTRHVELPGGHQPDLEAAIDLTLLRKLQGQGTCPSSSDEEAR